MPYLLNDIGFEENTVDNKSVKFTEASKISGRKSISLKAS